MVSDRITMLIRGKSTSSNRSNKSRFLYTQFAALIILAFLFIEEVSAEGVLEKNYLRIQHNAPSYNENLSISSLGMLAIQDSLVGMVDLSYLHSGTNGDAVTLDLGAGYAFNWNVSPYLLLGISLGYNWDQEDAITAYFPEAGLVIDFTSTFGVTVSAKRYFNLYEEDESIVMLGLVFRN